jgi:hypothetical protein
MLHVWAFIKTYISKLAHTVLYGITFTRYAQNPKIGKTDNLKLLRHCNQMSSTG